MATKQQPELIAKEEGRDPGIPNTLVSLLASPVIAMEDEAAGVEILKKLRDNNSIIEKDLFSHNETLKGENRVDIDIGITEEVKKMAEDSSTKDKQTICPEEGLAPNQEENKHMVDGGEIKTQETHQTIPLSLVEESLNLGEWKVETEANEVENEQLEVVTSERKEEDPIRGIKHKDLEAEIDDMQQESENCVNNDDILTRSVIEQTNEAIKDTDEAADKFEISSIAKEDHLAAQPAEEAETSKVMSSKADEDIKGSNEQETAVGELSKVNHTVSHVENLALRESTEKLKEDGELNPANGTTTDHKKNDVFGTTERGTERSGENDDKKPTEEEKVEEPTHNATQVQTENDCPAEEETTIRHIEEKEDQLLFTATKTYVTSENEDATPDLAVKDCPTEQEKGEMYIEEITREPQLKEEAAQLDGSYSDEKVETTDFISPEIDEEENVVRKSSSVNDTNTYLDNIASRESPETLKDCKIPEGNPVDAYNIKTVARDPENAKMSIEIELAEEPIQHANPDKKENDELLSGSTKNDAILLKEDEIVEHCSTPDQTENGCPAEEEMGEGHVKEAPRELELQEEVDAGFSNEAGVENQKKHKDNSAIKNDQLPHNERLKGENGVDDVNYTGEEEIQPRHELSFDTMKEGEEDKAKTQVKTEREQNYAANYIAGEVEKLAEDSSTKDKQIISPEGLVPNQENKHMVDGGEIKTHETLSQTIPLSLVGDTPIEENLKQGEWKSATEANEMENEQLEVVPAKRKEEDPIRGIIHKDQDAEIDDMLQESENYVANDDILSCSAIEQTNESINETDEAADKFEISRTAKEDHLAEQPAEVETSKVITSKPDGDSKGSNEQETVRHLEKLALRESTENFREDGDLNPDNGTTTDPKKNDVFVTTDTGTDRSENADKKPTEEENVEEPRHYATPVQTENDSRAKEETTARYIEEMAREQELLEKDDELLFAAANTDVETNTSPDNLTPIESVETLAQYNVSEGKSVHPEIKIIADCEENQDVTLEDTSAHNESVKIPSEDENVEELNKDTTPNQPENDCPGEKEKGQMHIEETREPELKEKVAQLLPETTKADIGYSDEKVETTDFIPSKIDEDVTNFSSVNDTNTHLDNLASIESPETLKESKIPEGSPVDAESINKQMRIKVDLAEEALQHATPENKENDPAEVQSRHVVETARELEHQEEGDELLTGTKKMQSEDEYIEEPRQDETLCNKEISEEETGKWYVNTAAEVETGTRDVNTATEEFHQEPLMGYKFSDENLVKTDKVIVVDHEKNKVGVEEKSSDTSEYAKLPSEDMAVEEPFQEASPHQIEIDCSANEETKERHANDSTRELELSEVDDELLRGSTNIGASPLKEEAENSSVISSNAFEDIKRSNEPETIVGALSKGNNIAAHLENPTLRESPEQLLEHSELTPVNGTTTSYIKTDDFVMTETGADRSENDDKKPREDCNVERETAGVYIEDITREPELHTKDDELLSGASKNDVETSEAISTKIGEDENITGKLSPTETLETLVQFNVSEGKPVDPENRTYAGSEKNKDCALEDMSPQQVSDKISSEDENVEGQNKDETPDQTEHDCPAEDEKRERHIEETTREEGLKEEDNELLYKTTKAGVSYADEKMAIEEPPQHATLEKTENNPAEGQYVKDTSREQEIQEEADESIIGRKKTDLGSSNTDKEDNNTGKLSLVNDINNAEEETREKREFDRSTDEETRERHAEEITRELELQEEADELPEATKTDVGYSDEKVETFEDMSPKNYEDENIVHKLSEVEPTEEPLQHATPNKKENDLEEAENGRQHVVETSRELELQEEADGLLTGTKKVGYCPRDMAQWCTETTIVHEMPSEEEIVEEPHQDATPCQLEIDCSAKEETRDTYDKENTTELEILEVADELQRGTTNIDANPLKEEVQTPKLLSTNIDEEENIYEKLSPVDDVNTYKGGNPEKRDDKINTGHESSNIIKEDHLAEQPAEEKVKKGLELKAKDLDFNMTEKVENSNVISSNADEDSNETIVGDHSKVNNIVTHLENLTLRESPEQLKEHSELTPANGTITTHEKTDDFVTTEAGADSRENDDKKLREDESVEEPKHDATLAQTENDCNVEEETAGGHTKEITRELKLHEKDDELLSGPRIIDGEISKAISTKLGEDETNTKLDDLTLTETLETLVQYNVSEGKPITPEYKTSAGCEKNKDVALEDISADQETAKIPSEDVETVEEQNKDETPDQSPVEDDRGERNIEETTRESEIQEEDDELLFKTTKAGVSSTDEKVDTDFVTLKINAEEKAIRKFSSVNDTNTYIDNSPEGNPVNADGSKKTTDCETNDDIAKEDMSSYSTENAMMSIEDEAVEEPPQHTTLEKTENNPPEGRYVKETAREQETQEEADESLIARKKTDLGSSNIDEEENDTGKLSLVNDTNNADTRENAKIPSEDENTEEQGRDETLEKREFERSTEETRERHDKEITRELELQEEANELPMETKTDADVGSPDEKVETYKDMSPKNYEDEKIVQKHLPTNDANTNVNDLTSTASAETILEYDIPTENIANQDHKNIVVFEKDNNAAMEDVDTSQNAKMSSEEDTAEEPYNPAEVETGTRHVETASEEFSEKVTTKVIFPTFVEKENVPEKLSKVNAKNTYLNSQTSTEAPGTLTGLTFSDEKLVKPDEITIIDHEENIVGVEMPSEGNTLQQPYQDATPHQTEIDCSAKEDMSTDTSKSTKLSGEDENVERFQQTTLDQAENVEHANEITKDLELQEEPMSDHENNDNTAREDMGADTNENAKMPCEIEAVEEPFQDETPGKKETDYPVEEETRTRHVETTREELQEEAEELITNLNTPDVGSSNEKVETSKAVFLKIDEEENVPRNLLLVNDTNTQASTITPNFLTESYVSEALPIKLDKATIADNEKNIDVGIEDMSSDTSESIKIQMPSEAQTVEGLSMDATLHQTENDCLTEDETGRRPDKEPTRELNFQEEADDLLLGTTKSDVNSLNEKIETSTTISPNIYEEGNVAGKLSQASHQSPDILMEHDTLTIGGQEKNASDNMEDMSADAGYNAKGIEKQIPREDKSVGEPCQDATLDQTGKHGDVEEETNGRHVKETTKILEIQQDDHDLSTEDTKTEIDISKVMSAKADEGSKVSIDQENIADDYQQESNETTDMDNLESRKSPENSIEYSLFEGQEGSPHTSDQEKSNDDALVDVNPLSLMESEKPGNPVDELSCNSTNFTRDLNFEDQEDSAEGDDKHKGKESKRTGKKEDHIVPQLESKEEAFSKENETCSELDSMQQQNEEKAKLPTMTRDMTQYKDAILGRNVEADKEELQSESSSKIVPESREVKNEQDERKIYESKNITEKCLSMESGPISTSSLNETPIVEILEASEDRENQNPCEDSPNDTDKHVAQAVTKPNDDRVVFAQQEMKTLDSPYAFKAVLGEKGDYHKDDNFINDSNIKTGEHESVDEPESFHVSSDSNELVTSVGSHDAILNASCGNNVKMPLQVQKPKEVSLPNFSSSTSTNVHQKVSADISLSEEDNTEQGKKVQDEVMSKEEEDIKPKSKELDLKEEFLEDGKAKEVESEGQKTDQDEGKQINEETKVESGDDIPSISEDNKAIQKKSHNILSGVGSKVKHSIAKVKKAITGKHSNQKPH